MLLTWPILVAVLVVVNAAQGTLIHPSGWGIAGRDFLALVRIEPQSAESDFTFPLLRDYFSLGATLLLSINLYVLFRQWQLIEQLLPMLAKQRVLKIENVQRFRDAVERANGKLVGNRRLTLLWMIPALVLAAALVFSERGSGVFWSLAPREPARVQLDVWTREAYQNWWGNVDSHFAGFLVYLIIACIFAHYLLAQNHVGLRVLRILWDERNNISYQINARNPDGYYGLQPIRQLLVTILLSLVLNASALVMLFLIIPFANIAWAVVWLVFLLGFGPMYVALPLYLVARSLRRHKHVMLRDVLTLAPLASASSQGHSLDRLRAEELIRQEVDYIHSLPTIPFHIRQIILGMGLYVIPVAGSIAVILDVFFLRG